MSHAEACIDKPAGRQTVATQCRQLFGVREGRFHLRWITFPFRSVVCESSRLSGLSAPDREDRHGKRIAQFYGRILSSAASAAAKSGDRRAALSNTLPLVRTSRCFMRTSDQTLASALTSL